MNKYIAPATSVVAFENEAILAGSMNISNTETNNAWSSQRESFDEETTEE